MSLRQNIFKTKNACTCAILLCLPLLLSIGCSPKEKEARPKALQESPSPTASPGAPAKQEMPSVVKGAATSPAPPALPIILSVKLSPPEPKASDTIKANVITANGSKENIAYKWSKNGEELPETSDTLSGVKFKRGDKITLNVTPFEGSRYSSPITVFVTIANSAPRIISSPDTLRFDGKRFSYKVLAEDHDGDTLHYSLKAAPQGMNIDSNSGVITWDTGPEDKGPHQVTIAVSDGYGGEAVQGFTLEITPEQRMKKESK